MLVCKDHLNMTSLKQKSVNLWRQNSSSDSWPAQTTDSDAYCRILRRLSCTSNLEFYYKIKSVVDWRLCLIAYFFFRTRLPEMLFLEYVLKIRYKFLGENLWSKSWNPTLVSVLSCKFAAYFRKPFLNAQVDRLIFRG